MKRSYSNPIMSGVCSLLILTTALPPSVMAAAADHSGDKKNLMLGGVLRVVAQRYATVLQVTGNTAAQDGQVDELALQRKTELNANLKTRIDGLQEGTITPTAVREEIIKANREALVQQKQDIGGQIRSLTMEQLDAIAEGMKGNANYRDASAQYQAGYTRTEKANALTAAVYQDLDQLFSMMSKRSAFMNKDGWVKDLTKLQSLYNTKDRDEVKKWLKLVGYAALGVAAVGLVSWGVASIVYSGQYNTRKNQLQKHFDQVKAQLDSHYNALNTQLSQEEQDYLNGAGFVWTICANYEMPDSISCNRYNYALFQGTKYCAVYCYKNPTTGEETQHSAPTCASPFIPSDCYDPSEYTTGYNDGYYDGYDDGYYDGSDQGSSDGAYDGYYDGYDTGESDGYSDGYYVGFADGYSSYFGPVFAANKMSKNVVRASSIKTTPAHGDRFETGYKVGLRDAQLLLN